MVVPYLVSSSALPYRGSMLLQAMYKSPSQRPTSDGCWGRWGHLGGGKWLGPGVLKGRGWNPGEPLGDSGNGKIGVHLTGKTRLGKI